MSGICEIMLVTNLATGAAGIPLPLAGRGRGGGLVVSQTWRRRILRGFPTPTLNPSPQGGGKLDASQLQLIMR